MNTNFFPQLQQAPGPDFRKVGQSLFVVYCRPCEIFFNPMLHENIQTLDALKLDANHMVVVYKRMKDTTVQRRIIQGPTVFVPEAEEWLDHNSLQGIN